MICPDCNHEFDGSQTHICLESGLVDLEGNPVEVEVRRLPDPPCFKRWGYREITDSAQAQIERYMRLASKQTDDYSRRWHETAAYGVYSMWRDLTMGWMADGDNERMEMLTQRRS